MRKHDYYLRLVLMLAAVASALSAFAQTGAEQPSILRNAKTDSALFSTYDQLSGEEQPDAARAVRFALAGAELARKRDDPEREAYFYVRAGKALAKNGKRSNASDYFRKAVAKYRAALASENSRELILLLANIAAGFKSHAEYDSARKYLYEAVEISRRFEKNAELAYALNQTGALYFEEKKYGLALDFYRESLALARQEGKARQIAGAQNNIALILHARGELDEALEVYRAAYAVLRGAVRAENRQDNLDACVFAGNIARAHLETSAYDSAAAWTDTARIFAGRLEDPLHRVLLDNLEGEALLGGGRPQRALTVLRRGLARLGETGAWQARYNLLDNIKDAQKALGQWQAAFETSGRMNVALDSMGARKAADVGQTMQSKYESGRQATENQMLRKKSEARQYQNYALFGGLLIVGLVLAYFWRAKNRLSAMNGMLAAQNEEITIQKEEIASQSDQIGRQHGRLESAFAKQKQLIEFKEAMTAMIVEDLKMPLDDIMALSEKFRDRDLKRTVHNAGRQMLHMASNIIDVQKLENAEVQPDLQNWNLRELADEALQQTATQRSGKDIAERNEIPQGFGVKADRELVVRLLANLLANAAKYAPAGGWIALRAVPSANDPVFAAVTVADNGPGVPEDKREAIFERYAQHNATDGAGVRSTGLGLTYCRLAARAHGGDAWADAEPDAGAAFIVTLPRADSDFAAAPSLGGESAAMRAPRVLRKADRAYLADFCDRLWRLEVYEAGDVEEILREIHPLNNAVREWKDALRDAVYASNEEGYRQLLRFE